MLRPATPLTVLFFVAFVLLLLSTISTPIVKGIPLASYNGVKFGVLGYCKANGVCSKIQIGYSVGMWITEKYPWLSIPGFMIGVLAGVSTQGLSSDPLDLVLTHSLQILKHCLVILMTIPPLHSHRALALTCPQSLSSIQSRPF